VCLSATARWNRANPVLLRILNFLTGDRWIVGFRVRPKKFARTVVRVNAELIGPPFESVNLFSGGLDSLIGAIDALESGQTPLSSVMPARERLANHRRIASMHFKRITRRIRWSVCGVWMNFRRRWFAA